MSVRIVAIVCFMALHSCTFADVRLNEVVSACRRRCSVRVTSGPSDVGFGDCFDACFDSFFPTSSEAEGSTGDAADPDIKRSVDGYHQLSLSKVFPRGFGSGSASKYLRIGRGSSDGEQIEAASAEGEKRNNAVDKRKSAMAEMSSNRLGNSAKSYLRIGKKSVEQVDV